MKMKLLITIVGVALIVGAWGRTSPEPMEFEDADMSVYDIVEVNQGSESPYKAGYHLKSRLWPNGVVPYVVSDKMTDYQSCYSYYGRQGDEQPISLGQGCQEVWLSAHETMHALGIFHEQSRPDRDDFVTVNWSNVISGKAHNFNKAKSHEVTVPRPFDFKSIMLYEPYAFSGNRQPTMASRVSGQRLLSVREKPVISKGDILLINHMYSCPAKKPVAATSAATTKARNETAVPVRR
ncbi:Zinc metalloproteinase nas-4 [Halotydeus destructor]|nr:Zinc metalloproteinase nas-4 [Halotydeus destructor]